MLYQGMLIGLPLIGEQIGYVTATNFETTWGSWLFYISYYWYVGCDPFVYLALNKHLREDVLKMLPKKVQNWFSREQTNQMQNQTGEVIQIHAINQVPINN